MLKGYLHNKERTAQIKTERHGTSSDRKPICLHRPNWFTLVLSSRSGTPETQWVSSQMTHNYMKLKVQVMNIVFVCCELLDCTWCTLLTTHFHALTTCYGKKKKSHVSERFSLPQHSLHDREPATYSARPLAAAGSLFADCACYAVKWSWIGGAYRQLTGLRPNKPS